MNQLVVPLLGWCLSRESIYIAPSSASVTVYIGNFNYMPCIFCDIFTNLSETKLCYQLSIWMAFKDQRMIFINLFPEQCNEDARDMPTQALENILCEGWDKIFLLLYLPQSPYRTEHYKMSTNPGLHLIKVVKGDEMEKSTWQMRSRVLEK